MGVSMKQKTKSPRDRRRKSWTRFLTGTSVQGFDEIKHVLLPHAQPYYDQYLATYVDQAAPYVKLANEEYVTPASQYAVANFEKYGRPHYESAKKRGMDEYSRVLAPHIEVATAEGEKYYNQYLKERVSTAQKSYDQYKPRVIAAAELALAKMHPVYVAALPYAELAFDKAVELLSWASVEGKGWVERRWGMHVEPQLWRIQERLGKTTESVKDAPSATSNPNASSDSAPPEVPIHMTPEVRKQIEDDLDAWSNKFATAGEKAISDVQAKLDVLCKSVMRSQTPKSTALLAELDDLIMASFDKLKNSIKALSVSPETQDVKLSILAEMTQKTGIEIRDATQQVRLYAQEFLAEAYDNTAFTVDETNEVLDSVQEVGIQELGMKWAWMDGVTYKDWARYHELKKVFATTKQAVVRSGQGHKGLREVTDFAKGVEEAATTRAQIAAEELQSLRAEGKKKIESGETEAWVDPVAASNLEGGTAPPDLPEVAKEVPVAEDVSHIEVLEHEIDNHGNVVAEPNAEVKYHDGTDKPVEEYQAENLAAEAAAPIVSEDAPVEPVSEEVDQGTTHIPVEDVSRIEVLEHEIDNHGNVVAEPHAEIKYHDGTDKPTEEYIQENLAAEYAQSQAPIDTEAPLEGESPGVDEPVSHPEVLEHETDNHGHVVAEPLAEVKYHDGTDKPLEEYIKENKAAEAAATEAEPEEEVEIEKNAEGSFFVQAAGKPRKINHPSPGNGDYVDTAASVLSDGASSVSSVGSVAASSVSSGIAELSKIVSEAIWGATPTGTASISSVLEKQYSSAYSAASSVLYGTPVPYHSSVASAASSIIADTYSSAAVAASDRYSSAAYAASVAYWGTPTPAYQSYASAATDTAQEQYLSMKAFISELVSGKEPDFTESVMSRFSSVYNYQPTIVARATDAAAEGYASAASYAGEGYASAASVAGEGYASASSIGTNVYSTVVDGAAALMTPPPQIEAILAAASVNVANAVSSASSILYGTTQGTVESISSVAAEHYSSGAAAVSQMIYGKEKTAAEQVQKQISDALVSARESLSEIIYGPPQPYTASVASVLSEKVYGTPQGSVDSATSVIGESLSQATDYAAANAAAAGAIIADSLSSAQSYAGENAAAASSVLSENLVSGSSILSENAISASSIVASLNSKVTDQASLMWYGKEQTYAESAQARLEAAVESARVHLSTMLYGTELSFGEKVSITIASHFAAATDAATDAYATAADYAGAVAESIVSVAGDAADTVSSVAGDAYDNAASVYDTAASAVQPVVDSANSVGSVAYDSASSIASVVSSVGTDAASSVSSVVSVVSSVGSDAASSVSSVVVPSSTGSVESLKSAASRATEKIKKAAASAKEDL